MTARQRLFIRVDATLETGLGHFNRCLALAQRWREAHGPVTFMGHHGERLVEELARERIDHEPLTRMHPDPRDLDTALRRLDAGATVVLDGYQFDYAYQRGLANNCRLLVIDDLGQLPRYAGSWLLNASVNAREIVYDDAPAQRLLGPKYALLRRDLLAARTAPRRPATRIENLLVSLGGADAANDTLRVLRALANSGAARRRVRVIIGPLNPHAKNLAEFAHAQAGIELCHDPVSMATELLAADFAIASAGTTSTELVYLGIPSLLLAVADNQLGIGASLGRHGAVIYGGDIRKLTDVELTAAIRDALADEAKHESIRHAAPDLVDGLGAVRTCSILSGAANV